MAKNKMYQKFEETIYQKRKIFKKKKVLQTIYGRWYKRIIANLEKGKTIEIGSGFGDFKRVCPDCIISDIVKSDWIDLVVDAHRLPFKNGSIANIVCIDVFHHLARPKDFFEEAARALKKEGRIILVDMYLSLISYPLLKLFHFENIGLQALASNVFFKRFKQSKLLFKDFRIRTKEIHDFLVYPLSGGFGYPNFMPARLSNLFFSLEDKLRFLRHIAAFKATVVLEKNSC